MKMTISRFADGLLTVIILVCAVPVVLVLLAVVAVWWVVAIVASFVVFIAGVVWPDRVRRLLASDDDTRR